ncbi:MAG TPA: hypothetical protein VNV43_04490 [Candidatus Acidoferrales bacterium]|nr:hypothetical protein [Candidatus Acidoferrales bacterium]
MKKLITAALAIGGAIMISQSAFAQNTITENDAYLGFQNNLATADYIINLGSLQTNFLGKSTVVDVSSDLSLSDFNSVNNISGTTLAAVVGADNNTNDVFGTITRTSNVGNPKVAGSTAPAGLNYGEDATVYTAIGGMAVPTTAGTGVLDSTKSWSSKISPTSAGADFYSEAGFNPNSTVTTSGVVYEDLYLSTDTSGGGRGDTAKPFIYQGYFTIDFTGSSPKVTFSSTNAPVTVSLSIPHIVSITKVAGTVTLVSTNALPTHSYQLQSSAGLLPASWSNLGSAVIASGTTVTNTDTTATPADRFYRIQAQ